jgi:hypothetical protein
MGPQTAKTAAFSWYRLETWRTRHTWDDAGSSLSIALAAELKWSDLSDDRLQMAHLSRPGPPGGKLGSLPFLPLISNRSRLRHSHLRASFTPSSNLTPRICIINARMILQRLQNWHKVAPPSPNKVPKSSQFPYLLLRLRCRFDSPCPEISPKNKTLALQGGVSEICVMVYLTPIN